MWQTYKILFAVLAMATVVSLLYSVQNLYSPKEVSLTNSVRIMDAPFTYSIQKLYFPLYTSNDSVVHQVNTSATNSVVHQVTATNSVLKLYNPTNTSIMSAQQLATTPPIPPIKYPLSEFNGSIYRPNKYVMALSYYDQQTSALWRLRSLQCWAQKVGRFGVVAPVVIKSELRVQPLLPDDQVLDLGDVYDMSYLAQIDLPGSEFAPLVEWAYIRNSPIKWQVILVHLDYEDTWKRVQPSLNMDVISTFVNRTHSVIRRNVSLCPKREGMMTLEHFTELLFGNLTDAENVVVIFDEWRGLSGNYIPVIEDSCQVSNFQSSIGRIPFSPRIAREAQQYISKFLQDDNYIALMVRTEIGMKTCDGIEHFLDRVFDVWISLKKTRNLNSTFLSVDVGSFGSIRYSTSVYMARCNVLTPAQSFFQRVYNGSLSMSDWEQSFVEVSGTTHAGYIAVLQKAVTVRAKCIVLAGGGNFQYHASNLYKTMHKHSRWCIETIEP